MKRNVFIVVCVIFIVLIGHASGFAAQIYLHNGDRLSGDIVSETNDAYIIETEHTGTLTIAKAAIANVQVPQEEPAIEIPSILWQREFSVGYNVAKGNTDTRAIFFSSLLSRKTDENETTLKGAYEETSANNNMDGQRWTLSGRHAMSFGSALQWYHFYKTAADHDKFASVDYRIIPAAGVGYWFSDEAPFKAMAEIALGYEHTEYTNNTDSSEEAILIPRVFGEWTFWKGAVLSEELVTYPSISDASEYRLVSTTLLTNPITEHLSLKIAWIHEYDSAPANNAKKHDMRLNSSLAYSF